MMSKVSIEMSGTAGKSVGNHQQFVEQPQLNCGEYGLCKWVCIDAISFVYIICIIAGIPDPGPYDPPSWSRYSDDDTPIPLTRPFTQTPQFIMLLVLIPWTLLRMCIMKGASWPHSSILKFHENKYNQNSGDAVDPLTEMSQYITRMNNSGVTLGVHVRCSHTETRSRTRSVSDGHGGHKTEHYTETVTVTTFSHEYSFTEMITSEEIGKMSAAQFDGELLYDAQNKGTSFCLFTSVCSTELDPQTETILNAWVNHLHKSNEHRDRSTGAYIVKRVNEPVFDEKLLSLSNQDAGMPWWMSPWAAWFSLLFCFHSYFIYKYQLGTSTYTMNFGKVIHSELPDFRPANSDGRERLPMDLGPDGYNAPTYASHHPIPIDLAGDGKPDSVGWDTTNDGNIDAVDSTGDGKIDKIYGYTNAHVGDNTGSGMHEIQVNSIPIAYAGKV